MVTAPVRIGLLLLAVGQGSAAVFALVAPRTFYEDFPVPGADWVSAVGPFNEHLVRDYGAAFLAITVLAVAAAWSAERRLVVIALSVWVIAALPHLAFHLAHSGEPAGTSGALSLVTLGVNLVVPLVLLFLVRKENPHAPDPARAHEGVAAQARRP